MIAFSVSLYPAKLHQLLGTQAAHDLPDHVRFDGRTQIVQFQNVLAAGNGYIGSPSRMALQKSLRRQWEIASRTGV